MPAWTDYLGRILAWPHPCRCSTEGEVDIVTEVTPADAERVEEI